MSKHLKRRFSFDKGHANRNLEQGGLNRAAIIAYLYLGKKTKLDDQFSMSVGKSQLSYWVGILRVSFMPGGHVSVDLSKDFKPVRLIPGE